MVLKYFNMPVFVAKKVQFYLFFLFPFLTLICFTGCDGTDPFTKEVIVQYVDMTENRLDIGTHEQGIDVYVDYSMSVYEGIKAVSNSIDDLLGIVEGQSARFFRVGAKVPYEIDIRQRAHELRVPANFNERISLLNLALSQITEKPRQAVFITDFELDESNSRIVVVDGKEYRTAISLDPWAKVDFKRWLSAGHQIDFYIQPFGNEQKLYIAVFTPKSALSEGNAVVNRFNANGQMHHLSYALNLPKLQPSYLQTTEKAFPTDYPYFDTYSHWQNNESEVYQILRDPFVNDYLGNSVVPTADKWFLQKNYLKNAPSLLESIVLKTKTSDISTNLQGVLNLGYALSAEDTAMYLEQIMQPPVVMNNFFSLQQKADGEVQIGLANGVDPRSINLRQAFRIDVVPEEIKWKTLDNDKEWLMWRTRSGGFHVPALYRSLSEAIAELKASVFPSPLYTYYLYFKG
jgi:hypothetical protein